jgi:hypothetical protein
MWKADHAEKAIAEASETTKQTLERNARGVTSEGGPTQPQAGDKPTSEMTDEELDTHVKSKYGVADWPS